MASTSKVYIVGVGFSALPNGSSPAQDLVEPLVSAGTKALLDAGVAYDDIDLTVHGSVGSEASNAFGEGALNVDGAGDGSDFVNAFNRITDKGANSALLLTVEESNAIALIVASDSFLWRRPYLKDEAALVCRSDAPSSSPKQSTQGLHNICKTVWALRGWSRLQEIRDGRASYQTRSGQGFELSRADEKAVPEWKDIEHKQDGKYRLGYNPATETRDISQEDFEAVRASEQRRIGGNDRTQFRRKGGDKAALAKL